MKIEILKFLDATLGRLATSLWPATRARQEVTQTPRRVLFVRPGGIGDAALLIPTLQTFMHHFPDCVVDVLAEKRNVRVFDFCRGIANVFCYDLPADCLKVWRNPYDVVIDTEQWYRLSAVFGRLLGGSCLIGFGTNERSRLLNFPIDYDQGRYEVFSFLSLLTPWGIELPAKIDSPFLDLPRQGREDVLELLTVLPGSDFIALCPGGSRPEKSWGETRFSELAEKLAAKNIHCVVLGGADDRPLASSVAEAARGICLAGRTTLFESAVVLQMSRVVVANDTGLLHLAAGLARPTVGIFGPSNPEKWGPRSNNDRVLCCSLPCAPCSRFGSMPECPTGGHCLCEIDVAEVFRETLELHQGKTPVGKNSDISCQKDRV